MEKLKLTFLIFIALAFFIHTCDVPLTENEVDDPGYIRVWVKFRIPEESAFGQEVREGDSLKVQCTNFRLYNDSLYTNFYQEKDQFCQDRTKAPEINMLSQKDTTYRVAYGSVPAYEYNELRFQMSPLDTSFVINGKTYPLTYQGQFANTTVSIGRIFDLDQDKTTDVYITFRVDKEITRIQDQFHFNTIGVDSTAIESVKINKE